MAKSMNDPQSRGPSLPPVPVGVLPEAGPESVLEHWNIWVGRQPCEGFELRAGEIEVRG